MASTGAPHTRNLAIACIGGIALAAGAMFAAGKDTKNKEGNHTHGTSKDRPLNSSEVAQAVKVPKPGQDRVSAS